MNHEVRIKKLPDETVRMIAAGEVIENVSSVVRELVENSIDAEAKNIEVELKEGGKSFIRVKDDGCGMSPDEIPLAVKRFTTSKIERVDDLKKKVTLGFRGEALYAIATVSRMRIRSSVDGIEGYEVSFEGGYVTREKPIAFPKGTEVIVADLFFNFPARRKFLGSSYTESRETIEVLTSYALAYPHVSFRMILNGKELFSYPATRDHFYRIEQIYSSDFVRDTMRVEWDSPSLSIIGVISRPDKLKDRGRVQWIFVNGRRIDSKKIRAALFKAYGQNVKSPEFILFLEVPPKYIDFNVHPQKKEVKFSPELKVFEGVLRAVRDVMREEKLELQRGKEVFLKVMERPTLHSIKEGGRQLGFGELPLRGSHFDSEDDKWVPEAIWQVHNKYIVAQIKSGIIIVDQHAAHERIIYEELETKDSGVQMLLFPIVMTLEPALFRVLKEVLPMMEKVGFRIRILSGRSVVIEGVPQVIRQITKEDFEGILQEISEEKRLPDRFKGLLKTIACKAAVKAGESLDQRQMNALLDQLFSCESPFFCPHGRPTVFKMTLDELDRKFERH